MREGGCEVTVFRHTNGKYSMKDGFLDIDGKSGHVNVEDVQGVIFRVLTPRTKAKVLSTLDMSRQVCLKRLYDGFNISA